MLDASDKPATGFDGRLQIRCTSDLAPVIHAHARRRGLTSASWVRMVILDALERGGAARRSSRGGAVMADIHMASIKASTTARYLSMAAGISSNIGNVWLELGVESLTETANALGYVLVRTSAQPSAEPEPTGTEAA
mgnify:CR=1 FL=1